MPFSMQTTADALEASIRSHRPHTTSATWDAELIYPAYPQRLTLRNVAQSVAASLGVSLPSHAPLPDAIWGGAPPQVDRVVLFLMDGLGYRYLQQAIAERPAIADAIATLTEGRGPLPLTSVAPSTTAVALTTLWTGRAPAAHGIMGTSMLVREFSMLGSMLRFQPEVGRAQGNFFEWGLAVPDLVRTAGIAEHLTEAGIPTHVVLARQLLGTGLSRILHRGTEGHTSYTHVGYSDFHLLLRNVLRQTVGQRCYINMYWPAVDSIGHHYGAHSAYTLHELEAQLTALQALLSDPALQDGRTLFLLLADHGHQDAGNVIDLSAEPQAQPIWDAMTLGMSGDSRLPILHLRDGQRQSVQATIDAQYADRLTTIDSQTALQIGLYGDDEIDTQTPRRLGDLILLPRATWRLQDPTVGMYKLIGWHGGLSDWEMLVPLLWRVL